MIFFNVRICIKLWEMGIKPLTNAGYESVNQEVGEENLVLNRSEKDLPAFTPLDVFEKDNAKLIFGTEGVDENNELPAWRYKSQLLLEAIQDENKTGWEHVNDVMMDLLNMPKE